jgi:hypothetical protein
VQRGIGVAYKGTVRNDDYRFEATIPDGLVGWGGVAPNAPFHGFAIFPDPRETSCILFGIQIRVELPDDNGTFHKSGRRAELVKAERTKVGNRVGRQIVKTGSAAGAEFENVIVFLELPRDGYTNDAVFTLVTPKDKVAESRLVFARFLSSFHFY